MTDSAPKKGPFPGRAAMFDGRLPSAGALARVEAHPDFPEAMRIFAAGAAGLYRGNRILNTVGTDRWRYLISVFAIHLHFTSRPGDPQSGLTASRLRRLCVEQKVCSPGRAEAMLALMRVFGQLAAAPNAEDRRLRQLVPTESLMTWHRERATVIFKAMEKVLPEGAEALSAVRSDEFMPRFICHVSRSHLAGFYYVEHIPEMKLFLERNSGMMILYTLLQSAEPESTFPPTGPMSASLLGLSRQFGVSRAHVRRVLQDAVSMGLIERTGSNGDQFRALPRLTAAFRRVIATYLVHNAHCVRATLADLDGQSAGRGNDLRQAINGLHIDGFAMSPRLT